MVDAEEGSHSAPPLMCQGVVGPSAAVAVVCGGLVYYHCGWRGSSLVSLAADVAIVLLCSLAILGMLFRQMNISVPVDPLEWQISQDTDLIDLELQKSTVKSSTPRYRESNDAVSPFSRDNWNGRCSRGSGDPVRNLRLTMKLRDFNKCTKIDADLCKELEQWNDMVRNDVIKLCQENNFNTGFLEGNDCNIAVDAYELKVRLEHMVERIALISDAASTERPSHITGCLFIGGALAARNFSIDDNDAADISDLFEEASDFIDYVEYLGGKVLVHCFEGRSRSVTVILAYLMQRKKLTLLEAWKMLKKVHRRAQPNDGFARILIELDKSLHGKASMEWQQKKPMMKVCRICGKRVGLSSSSLNLHLQKAHRKLSSGSVDSAMSLEIQKAMEALKIGDR